MRTEVKRDNGSTVPVNYSMRRDRSGWKAWDVVIDGISYVKSFRDDFGTEIDQKGLDEVISRMEKGGKPGDSRQLRPPLRSLRARVDGSRRCAGRRGGHGPWCRPDAGRRGAHVYDRARGTSSWSEAFA